MADRQPVTNTEARRWALIEGGGCRYRAWALFKLGPPVDLLRCLLRCLLSFAGQAENFSRTPSGRRGRRGPGAYPKNENRGRARFRRRRGKRRLGMQNVR